MTPEKQKQFWKYGINPIIGDRLKQAAFVPLKEKKKANWSTK